nr:hypothetical protein 23 [bacterium]
MANKKKYKTKQIEQALRDSAGLQYLAAEKLRCSPSTITNYVKKSKKLKQAADEAKESTLDMAEAQIITKIKEGDLTAIIFYLKTIGKERGYTERTELSGKDGKDLNYVIEAPPVIENAKEWSEMFKSPKK